MDKDEFLGKCKTIGVDSITDIGNDSDEGFKVNFLNGTTVYVLFRDEYGDAWMEYETEEHFVERWKNTHIMTPEESMEFNKRMMQSMKDKYSEPNFSIFMENFANLGV